MKNGFNTERSTTYRYAFFKNNKPYIKDRYFCSYCGRLCRKKDITIDHLYPINKAKYSRRLRRKLQRKGFKDINDVKNLVPACSKCNQYKSAKYGWLWIVKGEIGKIQWLWIPRHIIRTLMMIGVLVLVYHMFTNIGR